MNTFNIYDIIIHGWGYYTLCPQCSVSSDFLTFSVVRNKLQGPGEQDIIFPLIDLHFPQWWAGGLGTIKGFSCGSILPLPIKSGCTLHEDMKWWRVFIHVCGIFQLICRACRWAEGLSLHAVENMTPWSNQVKYFHKYAAAICCSNLLVTAVHLREGAYGSI